MQISLFGHKNSDAHFAANETLSYIFGAKIQSLTHGFKSCSFFATFDKVVKLVQQVNSYNHIWEKKYERQ